MALYRNAVLAAFIAPSGNISPACLQSVPTAAIPFLHSKIKVAHLLPERKSIMDNKIEVFKNEQFGEIRTALIENEPWFVAVDVCRALEIGNSSQAISRLDADEKMITLISNEGNKRGNPNMTVVNEPGLYTLILSSRKPEAKAFKRWITHDVIPMIRKTGCYMTDSVLERIRKDPTFTYTLAKVMLREKDRADALEAELNAAKPKADYYDAFINPDDCTNIRTTAKELEIPERKFVKFLLNEGYLFRSPSGQLLPYNKKSNEGLFIVRDFVTFRYTGSQTYFTPKGKDVIRIRYFGICGVEVSAKMAG
jgi:prophage antirepressor-like protein